MNGDNVMDFFQKLGFEEIDVEDGYTALAFEFAPQGSYALLTDEEGNVPASLKQSIIFAYYTPEGAFQWSTSFKNAYLFDELWSQTGTPADKLAAVEARQNGRE